MLITPPNVNFWVLKLYSWKNRSTFALPSPSILSCKQILVCDLYPWFLRYTSLQPGKKTRLKNRKMLSLRKQFFSLGDIVQTVYANYVQWFTYLVSRSKIKLDFQEFFDLCYCQSWWTADVFTYQFSHGLLLHRVITETEQNEVASFSYQLLSGDLVEQFPLTFLETSVGKRQLI